MTMLRVDHHGGTRRDGAAALVTGGLLVIALSLTACGRERNMPIVYDEAHSLLVGLPNMNCVPQIHAQCAKEVVTDAAEFAQDLVRAQSHADECRGIRLVIDEGDGRSDEVNRVKQGRYWQLRVDYKPKMHVQAFTVSGVHGGGPGTQGDGFDAEGLMQVICRISKDGGMFIYE